MKIKMKQINRRLLIIRYMKQGYSQHKTDAKGIQTNNDEKRDQMLQFLQQLGIYQNDFQTSSTTFCYLEDVAKLQVRPEKCRNYCQVVDILPYLLISSGYLKQHKPGTVHADLSLAFLTTYQQKTDTVSLLNKLTTSVWLLATVLHTQTKSVTQHSGTISCYQMLPLRAWNDASHNFFSNPWSWLERQPWV